MYCPAHFREDRPETLAALIERFPLATVIVSGPDGLVADHIPLLYHPARGPHGTLVGHVARSNPLWRLPPQQGLLVVFQGPSTYVSPNWYATKQAHGKVVPTWNYAVVHAWCTLVAIRDPAAVLGIVTQLTDRHEASQPHPWHVDDAPAEYTAQMAKLVVGIDLAVTRMQGKWKVSQNQPQENRESAVLGLLGEGTEDATQMAQLVRSHGPR
jgi:transcriptional regulator